MRWWWVGGLAGLWGCVTYSEQQFCDFGALPFDGQSDVPTDVVVELRAPNVLPSELPDLTAAVTYEETLSGNAVPFHVELRDDGRTVAVVADKPLRSDREYTVTGVDWYALRETGHWWGNPPGQLRATTFRTGSLLRALRTYSLREEGVVIAFSEAVDLETVPGRVRFSADVTGEWELEVIGHWDGQEQLVWLLPTGDGLPEDGVRELSLSRGISSPSGLQLEGNVELPYRLQEDESETLDRVFAGRAECGR